MNYESLLNKYKKYGDRFFLCRNQNLFILSDQDRDLITQTKHNLKLNKDEFFYNGDKKISQKEVMNILESIESRICDSVDDSFTILSKYIEVIQKAIKLSSSTHIRFFSDDNKVRCNIFDYRKFLSNIIPIKEQNLSITTIKINEDIFDDISLTLSSNSFSKIHTSDYQLLIRENNIVSFIPLNNRGFKFHIHDQRFSEPIINFRHEVLNKEISFLFQPDKTISHSFNS